MATLPSEVELPRELSRVKIRDFGPSQSESLESSILAVGERGIVTLIELDDLRVEVVGARSTYIVWPQNVAWGERTVAAPPDPPLPKTEPPHATSFENDKSRKATSVPTRVPETEPGKDSPEKPRIQKALSREAETVSAKIRDAASGTVQEAPAKAVRVTKSAHPKH